MERTSASSGRIRGFHDEIQQAIDGAAHVFFANNDTAENAQRPGPTPNSCLHWSMPRRCQAWIPGG